MKNTKTKKPTQNAAAKAALGIEDFLSDFRGIVGELEDKLVEGRWRVGRKNPWRWQPLKAAPKDRQVIGLFKGDDHGKAHYYVESMSWDGRKWYVPGVFDEAVAWMPIPPIPGVGQIDGL